MHMTGFNGTAERPGGELRVEIGRERSETRDIGFRGAKCPAGNHAGQPTDCRAGRSDNTDVSNKRPRRKMNLRRARFVE